MKTIKKLLSILMISAILLPTVGVSSAFAEDTAVTTYLACLDNCSSTTTAWSIQRIVCVVDCFFKFVDNVLYPNINSETNIA